MNERYCWLKNFNKNRGKSPTDFWKLRFTREFMHKNEMVVAKALKNAGFILKRSFKNMYLIEKYNFIDLIKN